MLHTLQRRNFHQVLVGRHLREVRREIVGCDERHYVPILDLQRDFVFEMHDERMENPRPRGAHPERAPYRLRGRDAFQEQQLRAMPMPALTDLLRDVSDLQWMRGGLEVPDERADAGDARQHPRTAELAQRSVRCHTRDLELAHELVLGRHALASPPRARADVLQHVLLQLRVEGQILVVSHASANLYRQARETIAQAPFAFTRYGAAERDRRGCGARADRAGTAG